MKNLLKKIAKVYSENGATIVCGMLSLNGGPVTYRLYESLRNN